MVFIDSIDATKFLGLTTDPYVQSALWQIPWEGENIPLVTVIANGLDNRHTSDGAWLQQRKVGLHWLTLFCKRIDSSLSCFSVLQVLYTTFFFEHPALAMSLKH